PARAGAHRGDAVASDTSRGSPRLEFRHHLAAGSAGRRSILRRWMTRLTRAQVREIDRLASERYGIPGIVLMENAALAVANAACEMLGGDCVGEILIICGGGNNGGDGLAAARHLHNRDADVSIMLAADPEKYRGEALA